MSLSSDLIVDRRRLRRQVTFWRIFAVLVVLAALIGGGLYWGGGFRAAVPHIARIKINGLITGDQDTIDLLRRADNKGVQAVILRIDSGGGTTAGSEMLYHEVRRLAEQKPVVAVIDSIGASGAYMTAIGADRVFANGSALVGSIGVIAQIPNISKLLDHVGVKVEFVRSAPLKAMPSGLEPTTPEARAAVEETVRETYRWFSALVGERRNLEGEALARISDGRVFTGRQAVGLKLIDATGDEKDAIAWLEQEKGVAKHLPVRAYAPPRGSGLLPDLTSLRAWMGFLAGKAEGMIGGSAREILGAGALDGLVSVWHPARE